MRRASRLCTRIAHAGDEDGGFANERHALAFEMPELLRPQHDHQSDEADYEAERLHAGELLVGKKKMSKQYDEKRDGPHEHAGKTGRDELGSPRDEKERNRMADETEAGEPSPESPLSRPLPAGQRHDDGKKDAAYRQAQRHNPGRIDGRDGNLGHGEGGTPRYHEHCERDPVSCRHGGIHNSTVISPMVSTRSTTCPVRTQKSVMFLQRL